MLRLRAVDPETATGKSQELLDRVQTNLGMTPNLMRTMASSPAVLDAYLGFQAALSRGLLPERLRERIALTVAEANGCDYCLAAHSAVAGIVGLSQEDILDSRRAVSTQSKIESALRFARSLVLKRGSIDDEEFGRVQAAGWSDGEIAEIVANVALNLFSNYFNHVAQTVVDFPTVEPLDAGRVDR